MQLLQIGGLVLALFFNSVQGDSVSLSKVVLRSSSFGESVHCIDGVPCYRVRPNDVVWYYADIHVNGKCLDLWCSLVWEDGCESAIRSHMCPCPCDPYSLFIPGECCHTELCSGNYAMRPYQFTVPGHLKCGTITYITFTYFADWYTKKANCFNKTYGIEAHPICVEIVQ